MLVLVGKKDALAPGKYALIPRRGRWGCPGPRNKETGRPGFGVVGDMSWPRGALGALKKPLLITTGVALHKVRQGDANGPLIRGSQTTRLG